MAVNEAALRKQMVAIIAKKGIRDKSTLESMMSVPRHLFVPPEIQCYAYEDRPLPIGEKQVISQPSLVARMAEAAKINSSSIVLEIGTGSGYAAAVLSRMAKEVYTIERFAEFVEKAGERFLKLGYDNIWTKWGDGTLGWFEKAPFDAIVVSAGAPSIPQCYIDQLKPGGRLIIPIGEYSSQRLVYVHKRVDGSCFQEIIEDVCFVPLVGKNGWPI